MLNTKPRRFENLSILLAEDEAFSRRLTLGTLQSIGIRHVVAVNDGAEALRAIKEMREPLDLIISDWNMPNISGLALLKLVRDVHPTLPFLMLTGNATLDLVREAQNSGVDAYVVKPFSANQLKEKIAAIFGLKA